MIDSLVSLEDALDSRLYGGKAASLARASASGLRVPPGVVLTVDAVEAVATGRTTELCMLEAVVQRFHRLAVRSSSPAEDTRATSLAGQLTSIINVVSFEGVVAAIRAVWESARAPRVGAYLERMGLPPSSGTAAILQQLVLCEVAGVMFTVDPVSGADERVIEASWGLGEAVLGALVTPDRFRLARSGAVLSRTLGSKRYVMLPMPDGGTVRAPAESSLVAAYCLDNGALRKLHELAARVEQLYPGPHDVEWGIARGELYLLQDRPVTA